MNKRISLIVLSTVLIAGLAACEKKPATAPSASGEMIVKIGSVAPLTGPQAHLGRDNDNGTRLALEEINAKGLTIGGKKIRFELMSEDDQADPKTATIVAQKLVDAQVKGVIGHLNSGTSIPASKIYLDAGIPQISPSATAIKYTEQGYKTAFRTMTNDRQQGKVLGEFAVKKLGGKRVAIIDDRSAYGQGLADEVEKAVKASGGTVVAREYTNDRATDFTAILTSIKGQEPGPGVLRRHGPAGRADGEADARPRPQGEIPRRRRRADHRVPETRGQRFRRREPRPRRACRSTLCRAARASATSSRPSTARFRPTRPYAYDATYALIEAMKLADSVEPSKYMAAIPKVRFTGVTGEIGFDDKGDVLGGAITLYRVKGGKWEVVETVMSGGAAAQKKK